MGFLKCEREMWKYIFNTVNVVWITELGNSLTYFEIEGVNGESLVIANFYIIC